MTPGIPATTGRRDATARVAASPLRRLAGIRRTVLAWRRPLAALLAVVAVLAGVRAAQAPPSPSQLVVVASRDLDGGRPLTAADLVRRELPTEAVPAGSSTRTAPLLGRTLAAPVRQGEPVTDVRVVGAGLLQAHPGAVAAPVRVSEAGMARLLRVGDHVDVVATDPATGRAEVVSRRAPVIALPRRPRAATDPAGSTTLSGGALVMLAVPSETAVELAGAAATDVLSLLLTY